MRLLPFALSLVLGFPLVTQAALRSPVYPLALHIEQIGSLNASIASKITGVIGPVTVARVETAGRTPGGKNPTMEAGFGIERMASTLPSAPGLPELRLTGAETGAELAQRVEDFVSTNRPPLAGEIAKLMCPSSGGAKGYGVSQAFYSFEQPAWATYRGGVRRLTTVVWGMTVTAVCSTTGAAPVPRMVSRKAEIKQRTTDVLHATYIPKSVGQGVPAEWGYPGGGFFHYRLLDQQGNPVTAEFSVDVNGVMDETPETPGVDQTVGSDDGVRCMFFCPGKSPIDAHRLMNDFGVQVAILDYARRLEPVYDEVGTENGRAVLAPRAMIRVTSRKLRMTSCTSAVFTNDGVYGYQLNRTVERWIVRYPPNTPLTENEVSTRMAMLGSVSVPDMATTDKTYGFEVATSGWPANHFIDKVLSPLPDATGNVGTLTSWSAFNQLPGYATWPSLPGIVEDSTGVAGMNLFHPERLFAIAQGGPSYIHANRFAGISVGCDTGTGTLRVIAGTSSGVQNSWHPTPSAVTFASLPIDRSGSGAFSTGYGPSGGSTTCTGSVTHDGQGNLVFTFPGEAKQPMYGDPHATTACDTAAGGAVALPLREALLRLLNPICPAGSTFNATTSMCERPAAFDTVCTTDEGAYCYSACQSPKSSVYEWLPKGKNGANIWVLTGCATQSMLTQGWINYLSPAPPVRGAQSLTTFFAPYWTNPNSGGNDYGGDTGGPGTSD